MIDILCLSSSLQPQILQPSSPCLSEHLFQRRRAKTLPTEGHSSPDRTGVDGGACTDAERPLYGLSADASGPAEPDEPSHLSIRLSDSGTPRGVTARDVPASAARSVAQLERGESAATLQNSAAPRPVGSPCPRMLQPPRLHKRVSLPALAPGGTSGSAPLTPRCSFGPLANPQTKQLPPPSRGLPCFKAGPQAQVSSRCRASLPQPRRASEPSRESGRVDSSNSTLEPGGS